MFKMEFYLAFYCICLVLLWCHFGSGQDQPSVEVERQQGDKIDAKMHRRQAGQDYEDIEESAFIFESESLPMLNNAIDYRYMPFVGNGHIATTIYSDAIYVNGVFNGRLGESHRARIPSSNAIQVDFVGSQDRRDSTKSYRLDLAAGKWKASLVHPEVTLDVTIYAHQRYHNLLVTRVTARRPQGTETGREFMFSVSNNRGEASEDIDFTDDMECSGVNVPGLECKYITGTIKETESSNSDPINVHVFHTSIPNTLMLPASSSIKSWAYVTSIDTDKEKARRAYAVLGDLTGNNLDVSHFTSWKTYWNAGRIEIQGNNLMLRKVLYGSQYYIKSSLPAPNTEQSKNEFYGVSPGGPGRGALMEDYQGHVFWHMETWVYPTMLLFHPEAAKDMLEYRIARMDEAYERARENGYEGLQYPWESAFTGLDVTPGNQCVACRENAQHVTADIAFAARQYVAATRDTDWLRKQDGCEFIIDIARFWVSRAKYDGGIDRYHIRDVMPPDEYHDEVDDSVYTNVAASLSIHMANYTSCLCDQQVPDDWYDVASKLVLLYDEERAYHPEYQGYSPDDMSANKISNTTNNIVKQADVVLLGYPFMLYQTEQDRKARENDLNIYRDVTDPAGPAMTWAMFSIGYREIGDHKQQDDMFAESYLPYVQEPFKVWTEASAGMGATNFLTGMGGFLQAVMFGYGGLRLLLESLYFNATMPPDSLSLVFLDLDYMGSRLNLRFSEFEMRIEVLALDSDYPLNLELFDDNINVTLIKDSDEFVYQRQPGRLFTTTESRCPLPIDNIYPTISAGTHLRAHRTILLYCIMITSVLLYWSSALRR